MKTDEACTNLWLAVFLGAVADAINGPPKTKETAIQWLFDDANKQDREMVCDLGGLPRAGWQGAIARFIEGDAVECGNITAYNLARKYFKRHSEAL